jgi:hypothetical protein
VDWTAAVIARHVATQTLAKKCVVLVDCCNWTGYECDVLAVTQDLRIIDIEVKISRADFKADAAKDKWWHRMAWREAGPPHHRQWPPKVWKHYVAMPADVWRDNLLDFMPSAASGLLLLTDRNGRVEVRCERRSTPNRDAARISPAACIDIARLANLRMWDAYENGRKSGLREAGSRLEAA